MESSKKVAVYVRVSTSDQNTELQVREIVEFIRTKGMGNFEVYEDKSTGRNGNRPAFRKLMIDVKNGEVGTVVCWKLDRLFRSLKSLLITLTDLEQSGVQFISVRDNIDLCTASGRLMMQLLGAFSEWEVSMIRERVTAGLKNARANGSQLGRPVTRAGDLISDLRGRGLSYREISKLAKCSISTVNRHLTKIAA